MARRTAKKASSKKAVSKRKSTAVGKAHDLFSGGVQHELDREKAGAGKTLSIRNSKFKFEGADLGTEINVILLDYVFVNQWFPGGFDKDNLTPPACFALAENEMELKPVSDSPEIQNGGDPCEDCWANEWESDDNGRGKACKNGRRVACMNADAFEDEDFEDYISIESVGYLTIPPTTNPEWRGYVNKLGKTLDLPPYGVVTTLSFEDGVEYPKLQFTAAIKLEEVLDLDGIKKVLALREEISDELRATPDFSNYEKPTAKKSKKKARKKVSKKKAPVRKKRASTKSKFA